VHDGSYRFFRNDCAGGPVRTKRTALKTTQEPADTADACEGKFEDYKNPAFKLNIDILCEPNALASGFSQ